MDCRVYWYLVAVGAPNICTMARGAAIQTHTHTTTHTWYTQLNDLLSTQTNVAGGLSGGTQVE